MNICPVTANDAKELLEIYAPYVQNTAITFEYEVPSLEEFEGRIKNISAKYPYIKAVDDEGNILGYAYAGAFKGRRAYDWSVETTVYVKQDARRSGVGKALYEALEGALAYIGILNVNACIAKPVGDDPYLTTDSIIFHGKMGYTPVGVFHQCGYKFKRWYDMTWMEKMLGDHKAENEAVKFGEWSLFFNK